jgi:phenylpyruvate tautomerase PptA (4-oxalocrotonate tautomerase family)
MVKIIIPKPAIFRSDYINQTTIMPLVTITSLKGKTPEQKRKIGDAVQNALIAIGAPETDRFQRFFDMEKENLIYDPTYPEMTEPRSEAFLIIEVLLSVGRSVKIKKKFLESLIRELGEQAINSRDVFVVFKETAWENWAFSGGQILHI